MIGSVMGESMAAGGEPVKDWGDPRAPVILDPEGFLASGFFVSDLHGDPDRYRKLLDLVRIERPDGLFLGGDLFPRSREMAPGSFVSGMLAPGLSRLRDDQGADYPPVFLIPGNLDPGEMEEVLAPLVRDGLLSFLHAQRRPFGDFTVYGYGCVPPTPFSCKAWERYDVARVLDEGSTPPEEQETTIERDLADLTRADDLSRAILLFHTPPYGTKLDRVRGAPDAYVGSVALRRLVESRRPLLGLHGHLHESPRLSGAWMDRIGPTVLYSAAHDGPELAVVAFDPARPLGATRRLF
jgi:Icc-related predicted phosphoesterase